MNSLVNEEQLLIIKELIHNRKNNEELIEVLDSYHPYDLSIIFEQLEPSERQELYEVIDEERLADIFEYLDEEQAASYLQELSYSQGADVLNEMAPDDAADVLDALSEDANSMDYLNQMDEEDKENLTNLIKYDDDTAGSIMSTEFISFESGMDVKDATKALGYVAKEAEVIDPIFVTKDKKLIGVLFLQDLITARTPLLIDEVMHKHVISGEVNDHIDDTYKKINDYGIYALPITENGEIVGIVTMDDAIDELKEDINEDMHMMAAISDDTSNNSVLKNMFLRIPWLIVLLAISLVISNITSTFEGVIQKVTILWFFNTMILGMAGNAGTQVLAVTIRHVDRGEINNFKLSIKYILRELLTLILNAVLLGVFCLGCTLGFIYLFKYNQEIHPLPVALVIAGSLAINIVLSGILGAIIPILLDKIHIDPAVASGPLITTINDILAIVVYFGLAMIFMDQMVL